MIAEEQFHLWNGIAYTSLFVSFDFVFKTYYFMSYIIITASILINV